MARMYSKSLLESYLSLADRTLGYAYSNLKEGMIRPAISSAYYSMVYAASAALIKIRVKPPKTHSGLVSLFNMYYIKTNKIDKKFSEYFSQALDARQKSTYSVTMEPTEMAAVTIVGSAKEFVEIVKKTIK